MRRVYGSPTIEITLRSQVQKHELRRNMKRQSIRITVSVIVALIAGFSVSIGAAQEKRKAIFVEPTSPEVSEITRYGKNAINRLANAMVRELSIELRKKPPEEVIEICHLKYLTMDGDSIKGLPRIKAVKLTSLKVRSPGNAPDAEDQLALKEFEYMMNYGDSVPNLLVQRIDGPDSNREWRVYRPLGVAKQCLDCHGDASEQSPALRAKLEALYPSDEAIGYKKHEWRGVIRVTVIEDETK